MPDLIQSVTEKGFREQLVSALEEQGYGNAQPRRGSFATPDNTEFHQHFHYDDLNTENYDIRLLKVLVNAYRPGSLVRCELLPTRSLAEVKGKYHALSYCAGDPTNTRPLLLSGILFNVFATLEIAISEVIAFWKIQYPEDDCVIWVDQICINQLNDRERSHQVAFMRDIYTNARETLICLSTGSETSTEVTGIGWLNRIPNDCMMQLKASPRLNIEEVIKRVLQQGLRNAGFIRGQLAFYDLVHLPWWRRAWVQQEFLCSRSAFFLHQGTWVSWTTLSKYLYTLCQVLEDTHIDDEAVPEQALREGICTVGRISLWRSLRNRHTQSKNAIKAVELMVYSKKTWRGDEDLKEILALSRHCRSTDPRDRVFAFVGLAHPGYDITPVYDKKHTLEKVLISTAKSILSFEKTLNILRYAIRTQHPATRSLPGWVPDWTSPDFLGLGGFQYLPYGGLMLKNNEPVSVVRHIRGTQSPVLEVQGLKVDTIKEHLPVLHNAFFDEVYKTESGYTVRCRSFVLPGDELWILHGALWAFVLRRVAACYRTISEAEDYSTWKWPADKIPFRDIIQSSSSGTSEITTIHLC